MRLTAIALVLCACAWMTAGDVAHIKAKAKLIGRLASKHHKRGVLSSIPPFKLGHDIPLVTHSLVKPFVVTYPPTATVSAVKVPLSHPLLPRYPVGVGHRVPHLPHPHYGLKFPHHTKAVVLPKPDHHFHHHHHHVAPRPVVPIVPAAPLPVAAPAIAQPVPVPSPPVIVPQPSPLPPPVHIFPSNHLHLRPLVPPTPLLPAAPAPIVAPAFSSFAPQFPYILRAGGAVQQSVFASYPRYPFNNYPAPLIPLSASAFSQIVPHQYPVHQGAPYGVEPHGAVHVEPTPPLVHAHGGVPQNGVHLQPHGIQLETHPGVHFHPLQPDVHFQSAQPGINLAQPEVHFQSAQPGVHLHPEQNDIHLQHIQPDVHLQSAQTELHLQPGLHSHPQLHLQTGVHVHEQPDIHLQPAQPGFNLQSQPDYLQPGHTDVHLQPGQGEFHFQGGHTDVHLHSQPDYHLQSGQPDYNMQPQPNFNLQPGQPDYNLQPAQPNFNQDGVLQPTQPTVDSNGWSPVPAQPSDVHNDHYPNDGHQFTQEQGNQIFEQHSGNDQQYHDYQTQLQHHIQQQLDQAQYEHHINNQNVGQEYGAPQDQSEQDFNFQQHQPTAEYGPPGGAEGRSSEGVGDSDSQLYHNHIPLGLQPPIDRPLENFR